MIEDCKTGKIDLIVTKSVSRFARNVVDCIKYARDLRALSPPVGIYLKQRTSTRYPKMATAPNRFGRICTGRERQQVHQRCLGYPTAIC